MDSEIQYATFANYSPRGVTELSKNSRKVCAAIKQADRKLIDAFIRNLQDGVAACLLPLLDEDRVLVPIPGSAPQKSGDSLWVSRVICERLHNSGFGKEVWAALKRIQAVPKSAFAKPGERPDVKKHFDSMAVEADGLFLPDKITLIDDVLTRGRTSYAAAWRINEACPNADLKIFAIIRTQGLIPEIAKIKDPSTGVIRYNAESEDVDRDP